MLDIDEAFPLYPPSTMVPPRPPPPPQARTTSGVTNPPTGVPRIYGPERTPLRRSDPSRLERAVGGPVHPPTFNPLQFLKMQIPSQLLLLHTKEGVKPFTTRYILSEDIPWHYSWMKNSVNAIY